jgi:hypothetical protein
MREDMFKVIVERPRKGGFGGELRAPRLHAESDVPARESIKSRHRDRKWLNENLAPLRRWLEAQVDRPWAKVYAELSERIDRRNTVQQHVLQHLEDFVAVKVIEVDGVRCYLRWSTPRPLDEYWAPRLYVDPKHGLLRRNRGRDQARADWEREQRVRYTVKADHRRVVSESLQLLRLDGVWYAVDVEPIPPAPPKGSHWRDPPVDAIRRCNAWQCPTHAADRGLRSNVDLFGQPHLYAAGKRQLSRASLRQHGLHNDNA